jgi:hypothetical protein
LERALTSVPVVLTLLSTLLAGISSSEMVRAQYYRSFAAQYQAKAADQWGFFQSKRMRATIIDHDLDLFPGAPGPVDSAALAAAFRETDGGLRDGARAAERLARALAGADKATAAGARLRAAARPLAELAQEILGAEALPDPDGRLRTDEVKAAFYFLGGERLPGGVEEKAAADPALEEALRAVRERRSEDVLLGLARAVDENRIREAVEAAEARSRAFEERAAGAVDEPLRAVDAEARRRVRLAAAFQRAAAAAGSASDAAGGNASDEVRATLGEVTQSAAALAPGLNALRDYQAARKDYTARRNNREAALNRDAAGPLEVRVYGLAAASDRHRQRSQQFFFGMLFAQAGAAVASLALAVRTKTLLWGLAFVAGVIAVVFSLYVYLTI